ncbi:hypothetical protein ACHQM5_029843 [Ranunculus cassubicifolius]
MSTNSHCVKCFLVIVALTSALYIFKPSLFPSLTNGFVLRNNVDQTSPCSPCTTCDCSSHLSLTKVAPVLVNHTIPDCGTTDPELDTDIEKQYLDRLAEELKLLKTVTEEHARHMNVSYIAAKRLGSQYEREAEKCNTATQACEDARERVEALLIKEKKVTSIWEERARKSGWQTS